MGRLFKREWPAQLNGKAYYFKNRAKKKYSKPGAAGAEDEKGSQSPAGTGARAK